MIQDREQLLTPLAGQLFNAADTASEYGSAPYDLKATGDNPAIGEPVDAFFEVVDANVNNVTNLVFNIVADDDGAGTNEVVMATRTVVLADLTVAKGLRKIGTLNPNLAPASTNRYLTAKVTTNGTPATAGLIRIFLSKATDHSPANAANVI